MMNIRSTMSSSLLFASSKLFAILGIAYHIYGLHCSEIKIHSHLDLILRGIYLDLFLSQDYNNYDKKVIVIMNWFCYKLISTEKVSYCYNFSQLSLVIFKEMYNYKYLVI